jgi:hypothetical protein
MAGMLVVDLDDGRGDECAWVSVADTLGLTVKARVGAHNGWGRAAPGADVNDPAYFVRSHLGQAGTCWDLYTVRGSRDTLTGNAGALGSRLAPRCIGCPSSGRESRQGPTSVMLRFYRIVLMLSGGRSVAILGPSLDRGQDDWSLLQDYLLLPAGTPQPRGLWVMGNGFGESEAAGHPSELAAYFRASLRSGDYSSFSGSANGSVSLTTVLPPSQQYGVLSHGLDVFTVQVAAPSGQAYAYYENVGAQGPYVASVYGPSQTVRPFKTLLDGYDLRDLGSVGNIDTYGRRTYVYGVLSNPLSSLLFCPLGGTDVPSGSSRPSAFLSLRNNPLVRGVASIDLTLAVPDRLRVVVHDIAGRAVKVLADRPFESGLHELVWDGTDGSGRRVASGVYVVRASAASGIREAKTLVVLR